MQLQFVLAMLRHLFTFVGGYIASRGWADGATVDVVTGAVLTIVGAVWSLIEKKNRPEAG